MLWPWPPRAMPSNGQFALTAGLSLLPAAIIAAVGADGDVRGLEVTVAPRGAAAARTRRCHLPEAQRCHPLVSVPRGGCGDNAGM